MPPKLKLWTTDLELKLIHEVRSRPLLWDVTLSVYRRNDLKGINWDEIACKLGSDLTGPIVKKRFLNMRDTFMDNHRKVKKSKRSGKGSDDVYVPKWPFYNSLSFLLKTVAQGDSISTMDSECSQSQTSTASTSQFMIIPGDRDEPIAFSPPNTSAGSSSVGVAPSGSSSCGNYIESFQQLTSPKCHSSVIVVPSPLSSPQSDITRPASATTVQDSMLKKRGVKRGRTTTIEEALELVKQIVSDPAPIPTEDSADIFGAFVASKLRGMEQSRREAVEAKIVQALYEQ